MEYVDRSRVVLAFLTSGYFQSKNCMRELLRAVLKKKRILPLLEPDENRGAMTPMEMYQELMMVQQTGKYATWGLEAEVATWSHEIPRPNRMRSAIFRHVRDGIEWNRIGDFQDVTMRMIGEALLSEEQLSECGATFVRDEIINNAPRLALPSRRPGLKFHVYVSPHNDGAAALIEELNAALGLEVQFTSQLDLMSLYAFMASHAPKHHMHMVPQLHVCA